MLKAPKREGNWSEIPEAAMCAARRFRCEICGQRYGDVIMDFEKCGRIVNFEQVIHHILSRRWIEKRGMNPHVPVNLISICKNDHAKILKIEDRLFAGDAYALVTGLRRLCFPMERFFEAARHYGLKELLVFENQRR